MNIERKLNVGYDEQRDFQKFTLMPQRNGLERGGTELSEEAEDNFQIYVTFSLSSSYWILRRLLEEAMLLRVKTLLRVFC